MLPLSRALAGHELHVCYKVNGDYAGGNNHLINDVLKWVRLEALMRAKEKAADGENCSAAWDFRKWHKADIDSAVEHVRLVG